METIRKLLGEKVVFHCSARADGLSTRDFDVVHTLEKPDEPFVFPDWMPPSMRAVLDEFGTMRLFQPSADANDGFRLFSPEECLFALYQFRKIISQAAELADGDEEGTADDLAWIEGLCPIAEVMASGDYFAIDTGNARKDGECPVVYLDHEYYFSGWLEQDGTEVVADDVIGLIERILRDPLEYLAPYWIGGGPYDQWFPESVSRSA